MISFANLLRLSDKFRGEVDAPFRMPEEPAANGHWLHGATAVLDRSLRIVQIQPTLAAWFGQEISLLKGESVLGLLLARFPSSEIPLQNLFRGQNTFHSAQIRSESGKEFYSLETARTGDAVCLRIERTLPPTAELAEDWSKNQNQEAARRAMLGRLLRAENQLTTLAHRWPGVIFSQRPDLTLSFATHKIEELTGVRLGEWEKQSQSIWRVIHEGDADEFQHQLARIGRDKQTISTTFRIRNVQTGRVAYIMEHREPVLSETGLLLGYEGVWLDVTRQTIAEKRLSSAAWKETLAVLTMGLAHDFSNIMAGILSLSEAFEAQIEKEHPFHEGLALIKRNSKQATQLVHRILNLHKGKPGERNYYNLNELITDMVELMGKIIPRRIELSTILDPRQLPLYVDPVEFRQVFINLTLNAVDAMPQGGKLVFTTSRHESAPDFANAQGVPPRLPFVCLSVKDNGMGIPGRHLASLFDPFFTTKAVNKGSGLGLYNARLFVEKHYGCVSVQSVEKEGSTFQICLPEADFTEAERLNVETVKPRITLMVVGNASPTLDATVEFLRQNGYYVVVAESEAQGAELLRSTDFQFSGVLFLATRRDECLQEVLSEVRRQPAPIKTILHIVGCHPDEFETGLLNRVDLVLPSDTPPPSFLARLNSLLQESSTVS
jgi:signal transduction histidine kinase